MIIKHNYLIYSIDKFLLWLLAFITLGILFWMQPVRAQPESKIVNIYDNGQIRTVPGDIMTVGDLLEKSGVKLSEKDLVEPDLGTLILQPSFNVNIYRARPVTVIDGSSKKQITTGFQSPIKVAEAAGLTVYPEDVYETYLIEDIVKTQSIGEVVSIKRSKLVNLNLYGNNIKLRTQANTVDEFLTQQKIDISSIGQVLPSLDTLITDNMTIFVVQEGAKITISEEEIPFKTQTVIDENIPEGQVRIQQKGVKGKKVITYEIVVTNGKESRGRLLQEILISNPVNQIEVKGQNKKDYIGDLASSFELLRKCESGGNYANKNNPLYRGAYQFSYSTWNNYGGYYDPADAPSSVQDQRAYETYLRRGWQPWPACSLKLGLR